MNESDHEWCRDTARDEAVRAAEDAAAKCRPIGAYVHTPTYDDLAAEIARLRLTDAEREAIKDAISCCEDITYGGAANQDAADVLKALLERTK